MAESIDEKRVWLGRVLGIGASQGGEDDGDPLDLKNRMAAATRLLDGMKAEGDPALPALLAAHAAAVAGMGGGEAGGLVDALEGELARAASAARGRKASTENAGVVAYAKLLLRWRAAQAKVDTNLKALGAALLSDPEIIEDPDFEEIQEAVADLPNLVPEFSGALDDILDAGNDPKVDKAKLNREALGILAEYRKRIGAVGALRELEPFAAETSLEKIDLFTEFNAALNDLESELSKAV